MGVQVPPLYVDLYYFRHMPRSGIGGSYNSTFSFWGTAIVISKVASLTNSVQEIFFPAPLPAFAVFLGWGGIYCFDLHFFYG
jgi:hypothetical protein